jgi:hypothetical protein
MNTWKTIGGGAAIASVLALGTALWWQRANDIPGAPQPQDSAETLGANYERDLSMLRDRPFANYQAAIVHKRASGTITNFVIVTNSITSRIRIRGGDPTLGPPADPYDIAPTGSTEYVVRMTAGTGSWVGFEVGYLNGGRFFYVYDYGATTYIGCWDTNYHESGWVGSGQWTGSGTGDWTMYDEEYQPLAGVYEVGWDFSVYTNAVYTTTWQYVTSSPAIWFTNTVGLYPAATFWFPDAIRAAIEPHHWPDGWDFGGAIRWVLPSNAFMAADAWAGPFDTGTPRAFLDDDPTWWTNWVTRGIGSWQRQQRYSATNVVWTNHVPLGTTNWGWWTSVVWSTTNYLVTSNLTGQVVNNKLFAFERDHDPYTWRTNSYSDMARALALMQWQETAVFYSNSFEVYYRDDSITTNTDLYTGWPGVSYRPAYSNSTREAWFYCGVFWVPSNSTPFNRTNIYVYVDASEWGDEGVYGWPANGPFPEGLRTAYTSPVIRVLGPYSQAAWQDQFSTDLYPALDELPTLSTWQALRDSIPGYSSGSLYDAGPNCRQGPDIYYPWGIRTFVGGNGHNNNPRWHCAYRVVFQCLTNYTPHAPAR